MTRQEEIQDIRKEYGWLYSLMLGFAVLGIGIWIGIKIGAAEFNEAQRDYQMNLWTEAIGVLASTGITVLILDRWNKRSEEDRRQEQLRRDLIREAGSRVNQTVVNAVDQLRDRRWLTGEDGLLKEADLYKANLDGALLDHANLEGAHLGEANLQGVDLKFAILQFADLQGATLQNASMQNSHLLKANLSRADLNGAHLHDTELRDAQLNLVNLSGAVLFRANLQGAHLVWAILRGADLQAADLRRTNLHEADLCGANLYAAYLEGATLSGDIKLEGATLPDGTDYTDETDMARFTERDHFGFDEALERVNEIRSNSGYDIA